MFYVYVLRSKKDSGLYIGYSADLRRRVALHKQSDARATASRGPWELIYCEAYVEQADALGRERFLKSGSGRRFLNKQLVHYLANIPFGGPLRASPLAEPLRGEIRMLNAAGDVAETLRF